MLLKNPSVSTPVHADAIWIAVLAQLDVRRILSPGLDLTFVPTFLEELEAIEPPDNDLVRLARAQLEGSF